MEEWALRRSAEQRLSLKALTHLERSLNKVHTARRSLEQELNEIEGNSTAKNNRTSSELKLRLSLELVLILVSLLLLLFKLRLSKFRCCMLY